jgi:hypothetical protein
MKPPRQEAAMMRRALLDAVIVTAILGPDDAAE